MPTRPADTGMTVKPMPTLKQTGTSDPDAMVVPPEDAGSAVDSELPDIDAAMAIDQAVADASEVDASGCIPTGPEICNDRDDDCDENIDEEIMEAGTLCDVAGEAGLCTQGSQQWVDGVLRCGLIRPLQKCVMAG